MKQFLPVSKEDMLERGISQLDFILISGDAYVDHPSFGPAVIGRVLESFGYSVGIIAQPDWKEKDSISAMGEPRLAFLVTAGNMDSMVNHYSVSKKRRAQDAYSPGGAAGKRPDYATVVYGNLIRQTYKKTPIIIGGIEASLRRLAHYDYWSDRVKRSILLDSGADLVVYGMGEKAIVAIAQALDSGLPVKDLVFIPGTVYRTNNPDSAYEGIMLPPFAETEKNKRSYAESFFIQYSNTDSVTAKPMVEAYGNKIFVVQNPPSEPLTMDEMDSVYGLPYMRDWHPSYKKAGGVPAIDEVRFSLTSSRGCFGGCSFCALTFHQGRVVQARSHESILNEAEEVIKRPDFKGYIHDVGGPTANFRKPSCAKQKKQGVCMSRQCLYPTPCRNLEADHSDYLKLLRKLRKLEHVKKVFIRSGIRFDYLLYDKDRTFLKELCEHHVSGQLKVAPEHISDTVLDKMGKPSAAVYEKFQEEYNKTNKRLGKDQYLVPYLMSSHPGSTLKEAVKLAEYIRKWSFMPEQVQDFYPTPSTISTCMYYTGLDPRTMERVYVPTSPHEKAMQRALIQFRDPAKYDLVKEALLKAGRADLIGFGEQCLIRPRRQKPDQKTQQGQRQDPKDAGRKNEGRKNDRNKGNRHAQDGMQRKNERRKTGKKK